jgi:hypothetical protein
MAIFKIQMMSGVEIPIESEEALVHFLSEASSGKNLVVTKYGIPNVASIDSITIHKEKMEEVREMLYLGTDRAKAEAEALGPSPFAKLLSGKMQMLSHESRTAAQEEAARKNARN